MFKTLKNQINLIKFFLLFKKKLKSENEDTLDELIELAMAEKGILFKLIQQLFPEKISSFEIRGKTVVNTQSKKKIIAIIEKELNIKFYEHFSKLSDCLYSASIGQVHQATLKGTSGECIVAIKIQYPHVLQSIRSQLKLLKMTALGAQLSKFAKWNISIDAHLSQIARRLEEELDYGHELKNLLKAQRFNSSMTSDPVIGLEAYCSPLIITQSWIEGFDLNFVKNNWTDSQKKDAAENLVSSYLKQIFVDGFFQGDTNFSNFIFKNKINQNNDDNNEINVHWIDFGNWCLLPSEVQMSLFSIIVQTIKGEDINYLGHFEKIGFDLTKLHYLENSLPVLVSILLEPFFTDRPYVLKNWNLEERINNLLGENKWWFRSSGNSQLLELMKSFYGVIQIVKYLDVNINWHRIFLKYSDQYNTAIINQSISIYQNHIPSLGQLAKNLVIHIFKDSKEHVKIELPSTAFLDLENFIPDDIKLKLKERSLDLGKIKSNYLEKGLIPGKVFLLETLESSDTKESVMTTFQVYLT